MADLILIRHGQSLWNLHNLFTGWVDVPLSEQGVNEALAAGERLKDYSFDVIYTSTLIRAIMTAMLIMAKNTSKKVPVLEALPAANAEQQKLADWAKNFSAKSAAETIPVKRAWQLNERYYGELQGMDKDETRAKYGAEQVHIWRRSYDVPPPNGEALLHTAERTIPYFRDIIVPDLAAGKNVLIAAHGNSLRSIVMYLDNLSREEVLSLELKTGEPLRYVFEKNRFEKRMSL